MINLDTHILLRGFSGDLRPREQALLAASPWSIAAIVLWEIVSLARLGRISVDLDDREFRSYLNRVHVWPLDLRVATALNRLDFRADPADELIAATSVAYAVPLLTRDRRILRSQVVPLA